MAQNPSRVNPPLDLTRDAFALNGGLDLVSPKINVPKGSLLDCSNREIIDRIGYKRIDGFEPFDGRTTPAQTEYYYIECYGYSGTLSSDFAAGTLLIVDNDISTVFGKVVATEQVNDTPVAGSTRYRIYYARINEDAEPAPDEVVNAYGTTTPDFRVAIAPTRVSSSNSYYYISTDSYGGTLSSDFPNGTRLVVDSAPTNVFGIVAGTATISSKPSIIFCLVEDDYLPANASTVNGFGTTSPDFTVNVTSTLYSTTTVLTARQVVDLYNTYNATLRSSITPLHDTPIGLHWFRDRLYAVVDDVVVYFTQTIAMSPPTTVPYVNTIITKNDGATARILDIQLRSGASWTAGNASGTMTIEVLTGTWGTTGSCTVTDPVLANTFDLRVGDPSLDPAPRFASLWRTKSEQQAIDETGSAGWDRIDLGYEIEFEDGFSDTGGFTVVNRGSENNFTFVTSSVLQFPSEIINGNNVSGTTFAPASKTYIATAESVENGDPGWKTNASASTFATGAALTTALQNADANYAYGNLFFQAGAGGITIPYSAGTLIAVEKEIWGPTAFWTVDSTAQPAAVGTETFDADWLTTNARAPIFLKNFSGVAGNIPAGALITGIEVTIPDYDVQSYVFGEFKANRNGALGANIVTNTVAWLQSAFSWNAALARTSVGSTSIIAGSVQTTPLVFPTTSYQSAITNSADTDTFRMAATLTAQTATIGSSTNQFGNSSLTRTDLLDTSLGIALYASISTAPLYNIPGEASGMIPYSASSGSTTLYETALGGIRLKVDQVTVRFHYVVPSARYYVGDGVSPTADVCSIDVTYYVQEDGSFSASTASGTLQFTNIQTPMGKSKRTVEPGDKLYLSLTAAETSVGSIAEVSSPNLGPGAIYNGLPSRNLIVQEASRYEFITANFFGRDEWDGFYGVSGAGRAFSFATYDADPLVSGNEDYLIQITTSTLDRDGDIPRHIAFHHYALALGFRSGIVRFSVLGEPENFDGVQGAAEIGVGDRVTGLLSMRGTVLGVFCENSIWGIAGTDSDNYTTQVLAPYTGAIEYTVVDMGIPVYCDSRGISTLEQSEKYGNFLGQRLSAPITPWILSRMIRNNAQFSGKGVVCAIPFRSKNQYVLFFKDGEVAVMTMNPDGPSFTFRNYYVGQSVLTDTTKFLVPFAWSSQVDEKGIDRVHVSHFSPLSSVSSTNGKFVYEMDQGWGFAGNFIPAYYTINWFYQDPFTEVTLKKVRLDGLTQGLSSCNLTVGKDYDVTYSASSSDISLPRNPLPSYSVDFVPSTTMTNTNLRGRSMSLKVTDVIPSGDAITDPIPPDVHQAMMIQLDPGGKIDN